ncbi:response regulator [Aurantivibrio plasticivorans]
MARKEAIEANQAKSAFLANTSHEIRTPINGILGFTSLMQKTSLTTQQKEYLNTIQKSSQGLLALLNDVLDVSKLETGQLVLDYTPFNLRDVTEGTLQALAPQTQEKRCELIAIIDPKLPVHLLGDSLRLKQVLINLVNNAIKFSDHCPIILKVEEDSSSDSYAKVKFSIIDQGIGISPNQQQHLFNAFSQADASDSRREGGVGLGLTVAKALVEKMQGTISLSSEAGKGSTFWFTAQFGLDRHGAARKANNLAKGTRVLVCESDEERKKQLAAYLTSMEVQYQFVDDRQGLVEIKRKPKALSYSCVIWDTNEQDDVALWLEEQKVCELCDTDDSTVLIALAPFGSRLELEPDETQVNVRVLQKPLSYDLLYDAIRSASTTSEPQQHAPVVKTDHEETIVNYPSVRILAVDDNSANLQLLGELLKDLNTEVTLADSGEQALALFQQVDFDLVFMDIQMPGIDGLEATQRIRQIETDRRTPVVALTAHAMGDQKAKLLLAGMDDYLSKPVTEQQLRHVIQRWTNVSLRANNTIPTKPRMHFANASGRSIADVVDLKLSLELANNKPSLARDMLSMLLNSLPAELEKITSAYQVEDFDLLATIVHKLNGGASYCGVPKLKSSCVKLEGLLEQKHYESIHHPFTMLLDAIHQLLKWHDEFDLDALFEDEQPA